MECKCLKQHARELFYKRIYMCRVRLAESPSSRQFCRYVKLRKSRTCPEKAGPAILLGKATNTKLWKRKKTLKHNVNERTIPTKPLKEAFTSFILLSHLHESEQV